MAFEKVFSSSVNTELGSLPSTLFAEPTAHTGICIFCSLFFLVTITASDRKKMIFLLLVSMACKLATIAGIHTRIYFIDNTMINWIWFVLGMALAYGIIKVTNNIVGIALFIAFVLGSVLVFVKDINFIGKKLVLGLVACYSIVCVIYNLFKDGEQNRIFEFGARYTMPVFLMHTIFAAPLRSVLLKISVTDLVVHMVVGIAISFTGPIVAMIVMEKIKPLDFVVYPMRYIGYSRNMKE